MLWKQMTAANFWVMCRLVEAPSGAGALCGVVVDGNSRAALHRASLARKLQRDKRDSSWEVCGVLDGSFECGQEDLGSNPDREIFFGEKVFRILMKKLKLMSAIEKMASFIEALL